MMKTSIASLLVALAASTASGQDEAWPVALDVAAVDTDTAACDGAPGIADSYYPLHGNGGIDVLEYDLTLAIDPVPGTLDGEAKLTVRALHALTSFQLELWALEAHAARVNDLPATVERIEDEIRVTPSEPIEAGAEFTVTIEYGGVPKLIPCPSVPFVPGVGWIHAGDSVYVMSQPNGAPTFFPCNDTPLDKSIYTFRITAPAQYTSVANGKLVSLTHGDGVRTTTWRASDPMVSYLATVAVGVFDEIAQEGPRGLPIRHFFHTSIEEIDRKAFQRTPEMIEFLEERFGPYPFESFGSIVSNAPIGAALETQTIPVYGSTATGESVVMHELAHQWFGNSVSVRDWSELWISEGFASYASWLWTEHTRGPTAITQQAEAMYGVMKMREVPGPADPGIENLFGLESYLRGPWVLHALRTEVGDDAFFEILRTYIAQNVNGHGSIGDFIAVAKSVSGDDAGALLHAWLYEDAVPEVEGLGSN